MERLLFVVIALFVMNFASAREKLEYGKDIQAISGATFSAMSITKDIPELTELLSHELKE